MKWLIALGLIAENQKKAIEEVSKKKDETRRLIFMKGDKAISIKYIKRKFNFN